LEEGIKRNIQEKNFSRLLRVAHNWTLVLPEKSAVVHRCLRSICRIS